jgi:hypothetical protein
MHQVLPRVTLPNPPLWSPDSRALYVTAPYDKRRGITMIDTDTRARRLVAPVCWNAQLVLSDDHRRLGFIVRSIQGSPLRLNITTLEGRKLASAPLPERIDGYDLRIR